jgi:hypothetical protein
MAEYLEYMKIFSTGESIYE